MAKKVKGTNLTKNLNMGLWSFIGILLAAAIPSLMVQFFGFTLEGLGNIPTMILGILGAIIAIQNITKEEEINFMISVATLVIVVSALSLISLPASIRLFLIYLTIAFGISGFIVAMGKILKMGLTK
ncbi:MAG: hypothetical protein ISS95_01470 [Candidatus Aenigmarchaeota archaeon]|nr:hypothetical protein [Candidatus Aenigmarchaeota archaeon]